MSRLAKKPIKLPSGVTMDVSGDNYTVKGPKGELNFPLVKGVDVNVNNGQVEVSAKHLSRSQIRANLGMVVSMLKNMIKGVSEGFEKKLEINGVGYRAEMKGQDLILNVGYSHSVTFKSVEGVSLSVEKNVITVSGIDKQLVGQVAVNIRRVRPPEPYKGKGIKFVDENIRRKEGKQVKASA